MSKKFLEKTKKNRHVYHTHNIIYITYGSMHKSILRLWNEFWLGWRVLDFFETTWKLCETHNNDDDANLWINELFGVLSWTWGQDYDDIYRYMMLENTSF